MKPSELPALLADNQRLREALKMALVQIKQDNDERKVESGLRGTEWQIRAVLEKPTIDSDYEAVASEFKPSLTISFTGRCKGCGVSIIRDRDFCDECSSRGDESPLPE